MPTTPSIGEAIEQYSILLRGVERRFVGLDRRFIRADGRLLVGVLLFRDEIPFDKFRITREIGAGISKICFIARQGGPGLVERGFIRASVQLHQ